MTRKDVYNLLSDEDKREIKDKFSKNFTLVPTSDLMTFLKDKHPELKDEEVAKAQAIKPVETVKSPSGEDRVMKLVNLLISRRLLLPSDAQKFE